MRLKNKKCKHNYTLAYTGKVSGIISYHYYCSLCDEFLETDKPIHKVQDKGYYEGRSLTRV